jgi:hypothetical protein
MDEWGSTTDHEPLFPAPPPDRSSLVRRLAGRLGEVRIHDTAQAGELARRLGARAFTVGRDVYVRPDLMRPASARSAALLAHELYHVGEQTGAQPGLDMPLLRSGGAPASPVSRAGRASMPAAGGVAVQRVPGADTPAPASLSGSELAAEAIESAVVRHEVGETGGGRREAEPPNPEDVADRVYSLMVQELVLDKERAAYGW